MAQDSRPRKRHDRGSDRVAVVLAGGGERVIAWETGVLAGLADAGFDARTAVRIVGTSAGALVAARLAAGIDPRKDTDRILAAKPAVVPERTRRAVANAIPQLVRILARYEYEEKERLRRAGQFASGAATALAVEEHIAGQAARLPDVGWPAALRLTAVDADTGERVLLAANTGVRLGRAVAAARAVPVLVRPISVAGRRLMDGALASATNADLLPSNIDRALVISATPEDSPAPSLQARWNAALVDEVATLEERGVRVVVIRASTAARRAMGDDLMSVSGSREAVTVGREQGRRARAAMLAAHRSAGPGVPSHAL